MNILNSCFILKHSLLFLDTNRYLNSVRIFFSFLAPVFHYNIKLFKILILQMNPKIPFFKKRTDTKWDVNTEGIVSCFWHLSIFYANIKQACGTFMDRPMRLYNNNVYCPLK